jgi:predicted nuclease of predicted toxin-antitoxin system
MKFKVDENLPREVADLLRGAGHDATTVIEHSATVRR